MEYFYFPDIPGQPYPIKSVSESGRVYDLKAVIYPNPRSVKKYTRKKQLRFRSTQAKIFDALINIGYWFPLICYREFPVVIQNKFRIDKQKGGVYFLDYYFPELKLAVELDSAYHSEDADKIRDEYLLKAHNIKTFRINQLEKESVQKTKFKELIELVKSIKPVHNPNPLNFS